MNGDLTTEQVDELTHLLRDRFNLLRAEIREELLNSDNERYIQVAGMVHDSADASIADLLTDVSYAVIDNHIKELSAIEQALIQIGKGIYGACVECDKNIGYARLKAAPTATRCLSCQEKHEHYLDEVSPHATI